jgi:hypothetical protein
MKRAFSLLCAFLFVSAALPEARAAVNCHCFRDRTFDPAAPSKADPYLLATARNGLLAGAAGVEKGVMVKARMTGGGENDLWIAYRIGVLASLPAEKLLAARAATPSWREALDGLQVTGDVGGPAFTLARSRGDDAGMARALADEALRTGFGLSGETVADLRAQDADNGEAALAAFLAGPEEPAPALLRDVRSGRRTWGQILTARGEPSETVGDRIADKVRAALRPATAPFPSR